MRPRSLYMSALLATALLACDRAPATSGTTDEEIYWSIEGTRSGIFTDVFDIQCEVDRGDPLQQIPPFIQLDIAPNRRNPQIVDYYEALGVADPNDYADAPTVRLSFAAPIPATRTLRTPAGGKFEPRPIVWELSDYEELGDVWNPNPFDPAEVERLASKKAPLDDVLAEIERGHRLTSAVDGLEGTAYEEFFVHRLRIPEQQISTFNGNPWTFGGELRDLRIACVDYGCLNDDCVFSQEAP